MHYVSHVLFDKNQMFYKVHEMAHAWHTMLDLSNEEIISNYNRVNESGIYENVPYILVFSRS